MNLTGKKFRFFGVLFLLTVILSNDLFSQYDDAQLKFAIQKLREKNLLSNLIDLTQADSRQSATRADVLMACYLIVRYLDENSNLAGINQNLTQLQKSVKTLERQGGRPGSEEVLIQRVLEQVQKTLPQSTTQATNEMNKDIQQLQTQIETLKNELQNKQPPKIEKLDQRLRNNTMIASTAVVLSLVITIFAAR
ncbi:hypothetical protein L0128_16245 [candidate division KSB1 bacterium]|nr:hypothetical protein [candidate division KSB1 bacterium]